MKKLSKLLAMVLAVAMICSAFAGCGNSSSTTSSQGSSSSTETAEPGALDTSEEVEIVLYVVSNEPAKQQEMTDNFNKIAKEKLNCTIKINYIGWAEYANKYPLLFSSGETFDLAYSATWLNFASLAQKGAFMNLDELWPTYAPQNYAKQSDTAKQQATIDGHYYCIPTLYATYAAYGPIYRNDILEGIEWSGEITNFETMEEYLDLAKANTTLEPLDICSSGSEIDDLFMYNNGLYAVKGSTNDFFFIDPTEENPQIFTYYDYEKTPEFLDMMNRWNEKGFFSKSALSDTDTTKLQNGIAALKVHNLDTYSGQYALNPEREYKYTNMATDVSNLSFTQDALVVSNTSKNPERAIALYELITSDEEAHRAFYYGIEGTSYEIIDDQVNMLDADNYSASALWTSRTNEFTLNTYGAPADLDEIKASYDAQIVDGEGSQKYRSFVLDTSSIETEYGACQSVHQQYWWPLELGYTDAVTGLEEYKKQMEAAGIEKVRETIQAQLDAYIASLK